MSEESRSPAEEWMIRPAELPPLLYDPRVHSRQYVLAYLDRTGASPQERDGVLRQADELEQRALALGYPLATEAFGLDESLPAHTPPFTPPGPGAEG